MRATGVWPFAVGGQVSRIEKAIVAPNSSETRPTAPIAMRPMFTGLRPSE